MPDGGKLPGRPTGADVVRHRRLAAAALILALLAAAAARFLWLDAKPLWNDEAFGLRTAMLPLDQLVASIALDVHPPLYYALLRGWLLLVPGDATGRHLSALVGLVALPATWLLAREVIGGLRAAGAVALCAILPLYVSWAQISRGYALLLACSMLALLAAARILALLEATPAPAARGRLLAWGALYAVAAAAALWTHNIAVFLLLGINAAAGWRLLAGQLGGIRGVLAWSLCQLAAIVLWAPWVPSLLAQSTRLGLAHFVVTAGGMVHRTAELFGGFMLWKLGALAGGIGLAAALLGLARIDRRGAAAQVVVAGIVVPILACVGLFFAGKPAFGYSILNLIWIPALLAILVAANLRRPRGAGALLGLALVAAFAVLVGRGLSNWYATPNPGWEAMAARLAEVARPGDAILAQTTLVPGPAAVARGEVPLHALQLHWTRLRGDAALPPLALPPDEDEAALRRWMEAQQRIWVPHTLPTPESNLAMRAIALARQQPAQWRVTEETIERLGLARLDRVTEAR